MKKLKEYPEAIESAKLKIDDLWKEFFDLKEKEEALEAQYKQEAANDPDLTNSTKRKAYVNEQKSSEEYQQATEARVDAKTAINEMEFWKERLEDEFEVAKIRAMQQVTDPTEKITGELVIKKIAQTLDKTLDLPNRNAEPNR